MHVIAVYSGRSGSGKTLFLEKLVSLLSGKGCVVPVIKHIHHGGLTLMENKDTERLFLAGASPAVAYAGDKSMVLLRGVGLEDVLGMVEALSGSKVLLVEGFRGQVEADEVVYISYGPGDRGCLEPGVAGRIIVSTSLSGEAECPRFMPFEEAVRHVASYILSTYCPE